MKKQTILKIEKNGILFETENPFIFCAHHKDNFPKGNSEQGPDVSMVGRTIGNDFSGKDGFSMYHGEKVPGFPVHPHRGFETVTVVLKGLVDHYDSKGSEGRYGNGDTQWLTTGSGCQHTEMFPLVNKDKENPLELFQIWLNLPSKDKFVEPTYKMLWAEATPEVKKIDGGGKETNITLVAGSYNGTRSLAPAPDSWANKDENHVNIWRIQMEPKAIFELPKVSSTLNRSLYFYEGDGNISIDDENILSSSRIKLAGDSDITIQNGSGESYLLLLEGEPIEEPMVAYGPFVMNTEEEIQEAYRDYQNTQFGGWPWDSPDPVHELNSGRFAKFIDGKIEVPPSKLK